MVIIDLVFSKLTFCTVLQFPGPTMEDDKENVNVDVSGEEVNICLGRLKRSRVTYEK